MIGQAGQWTRTPSTTPLQPKKMKCSFLDYVPFWWSAWLIDELEPHLPPFSYQKMKCSIFDYVQLLMIGWAGKWTQTPSFTPLLPKNEMLIFWLCSTSDVGQTGQWTRTPSTTPSPANKMKCSFLDYVHFWWSARLVDGLKPHLPPLSRQKNEMLIFWLCSTSDDWPGWSMDSNLNLICHPSPTKKMKCSIFDYVQLLMISQAGQLTQTPSTTLLQPIKWNASFGLCSLLMISQAGWWTQTPSATPLQPIKWNAHFWITFNFWCWPDWSMNSNPIYHPSPAKKMKCSFLDYIQLLMIFQAGWWTQTPSITCLQPKKWNPHFCITLNFWWSAGLVDGLEPHLPPLSSQKNEMLIFGFCSTSDDQPGWSMDSNPICHPSPAKKWNATFWIMFNFWWSAGLVNGLKPHPPPLSSQRNEMLIFVLCSTSNDRLGWSMDSNPIHHPSSAKKVRCSFLYYIQHLMLARLVNGLEPHPALLSIQKYEMLIFGLHSTSDD